MMKWWGWGDERITFPMESKPKLWPWVVGKLGLEHRTATPPIERAAIRLDPPIVNGAFCDALVTMLTAAQMTSDEHERLLHTYGKSYPDLIRVRRGEVHRAPDLVVLPESHEQVEAIVRAAHAHEVCLIPFGGGTNIVGCVEPLDLSGRMVVSVDMRRMNRLLTLDPYSMTATIQAGALGPKLEADLQARGFSLGHYPDSFEYSTLGGWIATRSAGMQSDEYGKIESMVVAVRMVTPVGTLETRPVPASSAGPDLNRVVLGSEGTLGIITEATMRVHRVPAVKDYRGFLFKNFEDGVKAIHECLAHGFVPSMIRLQDRGESELAFNLKAPKKGWHAFLEKGVKKYLKGAGYTSPCIMIVGFEGEEASLVTRRAGALKIIKQNRGFSLGKGVGKTWSADKFNVPYLRDYIMDYGCMVDVSETSATWANVLPLYRNTIAAVNARFAAEGLTGYVGCHISHTYETGACLYFTYAAKQIPGYELEQYYGYKALITETFMKAGGTLTHHHAVGYEHMPWMENEVSATGIVALKALKKSLDPKSLFNPCKVIPAAQELPPRTLKSARKPEMSEPELSL